MNEFEASLVVDWYLEMENRLSEVLKTTLYTDQTSDIFLSPLPGIIVDAGGLLDAVFREAYSGTRGRSDLTINDYREHYGSRLARVGSVLYQTPLVIVRPFSQWAMLPPTNPSWWRSYNSLKHDRIGEYGQATLSTALHVLCALKQLLSRLPQFQKALLRRDLFYFGSWAPSYALEAVFDPEHHRDVTILVETPLFGTPVGALGLPDDPEAIEPWQFGSGRKLSHFIGRHI